MEDRGHPYALPLGEPVPAIDIRVVASTPHPYLGGDSGLYISMVIIDCYSKDVVQADFLAQEIISPKNGVVGYQGSQSGIIVRNVTVEEGVTNDQDGVYPGGEEYRFVSSVSLNVTWCLECR